ncbi:cytochrome C, partial [bacterium]|nr:cytochrome C [bacterium]
MKKWAVLGMLLGSTVAVYAADDARLLAKMPPPAEAALREEMRDNTLSINEILTLLAAGQVKEAGELAEKKLGKSAMGRHRDKPFEARPGPHMPPDMHRIGMDRPKGASEFASIAATGDRDKALAALPAL